MSFAKDIENAAAAQLNSVLTENARIKDDIIASGKMASNIKIQALTEENESLKSDLFINRHAKEMSRAMLKICITNSKIPGSVQEYAYLNISAANLLIEQYNQEEHGAFIYKAEIKRLNETIESFRDYLNGKISLDEIGPFAKEIGELYALLK